jgi:hypothetical protein
VRALPSFEVPPRGAAPTLGADTRARLQACDVDEAVIAACLDAMVASD